MVPFHNILMTHSFVSVQNSKFDMPNKTKSLFKGNVDVLQSVNIRLKWWCPLKHTPNNSQISRSMEFAAKHTLEKLNKYKKLLENVKIIRNWLKTQVIKFLLTPHIFSLLLPSSFLQPILLSRSKFFVVIIDNIDIIFRSVNIL